MNTARFSARVTCARTKIGLVLSERTRILITITSVAALLVFIGWVFWVQDVRYMLPTPKPPGLVQPAVGAPLPIDAWLARMGLSADGRPMHLHVFNPECPCSKFNADHVRELFKTYGQQVRFVGLVQLPAGANAEEKKDAQEQALALNLGMPLWMDEGGAIARAAGVYSTPQAVILNASGTLVFRGNYNLSRYHVDPRTEYARHALESLVGFGAKGAEGDPRPQMFNLRNGQAFADPNLPAYGCELPKNSESAIVPALMVSP